ncbi:MAG: alpha/beta hydrolase fold domain-containing protein [Dysgonomonas sp.]
MKKIYILFFFSFLLISSVLSQNIVYIDGIPRDTSFTVYGTYIKERKNRPHIKPIYPNLPENVEAHEGLVYSTLVKTQYGDRDLHLNLYRPKDDKKYPALLMVHGGGWSSGDLTLQVPMAQQIAAEGYVTIPVEYRLSSEAKYPAAVFDLKTAVKWIRKNADKYGIDTTKIAISGCSAGGQLANLIGATNGNPAYEDKTREYAEFSSDVHAVINVDGISDFTTDQSVNSAKEALKKNKIPASVKWFDGTFDEKKENWIAASPLFQVTEKSVSVCFINSSIDRFHDGRDEMIAKLNTYNIYTEVHTIPETPHPFWLLYPWFDTTVYYMVSYLDKVF